MDKQVKLKQILSAYGKIALALSGGLDSSFLLAQLCRFHFPALAITVHTPYMPEREIKQAQKRALEFNIPHHTIKNPIPDLIRNNPENRCYLCKSELFSKIIQKSKKWGCQTIIDGTNASDDNDHRPGHKALYELQIKSPLREAGYSKDDIRRQAKEQKLSFWDMPAYACLLTRLPHGTQINVQDLERIEKAEDFLIGNNIRGIRVRKHGNIARIEAGEEEFDEIIRLKSKISQAFKSMGFRYVAIELSGYHTGNMNAESI